MNHYKARQREVGGRPAGIFDYTVGNKRTGIRSVGYCAGYPDFPRMAKLLSQHHADEAQKKAEPFKERYHTCGHATQEEAEQCYRSYLLDQCLRLDGETLNQQFKCRECGEWTQGFAEVAHGAPIVLCAAHRTREFVEKHWEFSPECWSSF